MLLISVRGGGIFFSEVIAAFDLCYFLADKQEEIEGK